MNILFLLRLWPVYGGGETVTITLANEMVKRGWNVNVMYFKENTRKVLPYINPKIIVHHLENIACDEFVAHEDDADKVRNYIKILIESQQIDAVINQWYPVEYIKGLKGGRAKIVTCLHTAFFNPIFETRGAKGVLKRILKPFYMARKKRKCVKSVLRFLPYVDKYVFLSSAFKKQFLDFSKLVNTEALGAVSNPLVYNCTVSAKEILEKKNEVLLVGRMIEGPKKISLALQIWSEIEKKESLKNWQFTLVGNGPDLEFYKNLAIKLNLKRVSFEGFQDPVPYYERAKIFLMTSAFEGFPMTLIEAAQFGVVPIAFDSFLSVHDIIIDGRNGRIIPNNDVKLYEQALITLMEKQQELERLRSNAIVDCEKFKVSKIVDLWEKILK
ncbi:glycosyltransferase [Candidatus Saccharibacteria bacterium]|nr:glycosyltransferase [Candidatus Saccharibacteria bacterium]